MNPPLHVAVLIGSLRAASLSRKIAHALMERAPRSLECDVVEIGDLPLYNEDLETECPPAAWTTFRTRLQKADAVLFVTPEYNRSIPGCLKNALDVGSRPPQKSVFRGKPAGVVSVSPSRLGAFGANHALRQTFVFLEMPVLQQPEVYLGTAKQVLDDDGNVRDTAAAALLQKFMQAFATWAETLHAGARSDPFEAFLDRRQVIARDYVNGDPTSLESIVTRNDPATFFDPAGKIEQGAASIWHRYEQDAHAFEKGGSTELEILQSGASDTLAFWTGFQHAEVRLAEGDKVPMTLRVTEVFRLEGGQYKLVHRHADRFDPPKRAG